MALVFISLKEVFTLLLFIIVIFFLTIWGIGKRAKAIKQSKKF